MTANDVVTAVVSRTLDERGMTRTDLARVCGRTIQWATHKMNGHRRWSLDDIDALATGLSMPPAWLLMPPSGAVDTHEYRPRVRRGDLTLAA